jgi:hypothetical protein
MPEIHEAVRRQFSVGGLPGRIPVGGLMEATMSEEGVDKTDHSILEHVAEDRTTSQLQEMGFLVAKPKNDQNGTDLLVFMTIKDGVKFCRAQCKGRTVSPTHGAHIEIPQDYVTPGFVLFLFLTIDPGDGTLYFFEPNTIKNWNKNNEGAYTMRISPNYKKDLESWVFSTDSIVQIQTIIKDAETSGEFRFIVFGKVKAEISLSITGSATGHHGPPMLE